jgi:hypothetical protein
MYRPGQESGKQRSKQDEDVLAQLIQKHSAPGGGMGGRGIGAEKWTPGGQSWGEGFAAQDKTPAQDIIPMPRAPIQQQPIPVGRQPNPVTPIGRQPNTLLERFPDAQNYQIPLGQTPTVNWQDMNVGQDGGSNGYQALIDAINNAMKNGGGFQAY